MSSKPVARGDGEDQVQSATGTGPGCALPMITETDECSDNVFVNEIGIVRKDDMVAPHPLPGCVPVDQSVVNVYSSSVFANNRNVARQGDEYSTMDPNTIISGSPNVFAGD